MFFSKGVFIMKTRNVLFLLAVGIWCSSGHLLGMEKRSVRDPFNDPAVFDLALTDEENEKVRESLEAINEMENKINAQNNVLHDSGIKHFLINPLF